MELSLYTKASELSEAHAKGKHVVVIDVLRASSTIVTASENGVERIIPVAAVEDAKKLVPTLGRKNVLLGGEQDGKRIEGFDLGNSPLEYTPEVVTGKTIILSTSNGTVAIAGSAPAKEIVIASFLNLTAVAAHLVSARPKGVAVLCAGNLGQLSLEDFVCGGLLVERMDRATRARLVLNDGAVAARALAAAMPDVGEVVRSCAHGRRLAELGFAADLDLCATVDRYATVPVAADGRIAGREAARR
ncbi:MAG: 2-phosphosulfolactate phosphatase [Candidatus Eisenbacteria bacterium]|nr:2-phosphosulfolactate phosphatase [Candidatus Eisenbacteria bacterium]